MGPRVASVVNVNTESQTEQTQWHYKRTIAHTVMHAEKQYNEPSLHKHGHAHSMRQPYQHDYTCD
jgi:polyphosphate kinase 2 (PPK2 family)